MIEKHSVFSIHPIVLIMAFLLDIAIGDPRWLPHPVRIMGHAIVRTEGLLRRSEVRSQKSEVTDRLKGIILVITIVLPTFLITLFIVHILSNYFGSSNFLLLTSYILLIYLVSTTVAVRELIDSAWVVIKSIKFNDISSARENLSMIVGRDTKGLSEKGILKATIETLSENLSDGVIAPLFYLAIGGLPFAMAYKAINTLDSMVGYKNDKYRDFGWAAARLDDIANYIPARISGILIVVASFIVSRSFNTANCALKTMINDGRKHPSPNAGIPEAAIAGALGVRLGGPSTYNGVLVQKPYIGIEKTGDYLSASEKAMALIRLSSVIGAIIATIILYIRVMI